MNETEIDALAAAVAEEIRAERSVREPAIYFVDEQARTALDESRDDDRMS